jgi:hypothetical protein
MTFRLVGAGLTSVRPAASTCSGGTWIDEYGRQSYSNGTTWIDVLYDDWRWAGLGKGTGPSNPARTVLPGGTTECWEFANAKTLHSDGNQIPHDYKEGTDIVPHIHWMFPTAGNYVGTWTMRYQFLLSVANGTILPDEVTVTAAFNKTGALARECMSMDFNANIAGAGAKISAILHANLTLTLTTGTSLFLHGWDGHYEKDAPGSIAILSKNG